MRVNKEYVEDRMFDVRIRTKKEFLKKINMQPDTYNKKMAGRRDWKLYELWMISQVLDCEVQDLLIKESDENDECKRKHDGV